jgi:hypothetical protein
MMFPSPHHPAVHAVFLTNSPLSPIVAAIPSLSLQTTNLIRRYGFLQTCGYK